MSKIEIHMVGQVVASNKSADIGKYTRIGDDTEGSTGGFYIFTADDPATANNVFDYWIEKKENLPKLFQGTGWEVQWLEGTTVAQYSMSDVIS